MKSIKELRQQRAAKAERGKLALTEFNALAAKPEADRSEADTAKLDALDGELTALEAEVKTLDQQIDALEAGKRRSALFTGGALAGLAAGRTYEPGPGTAGFHSVAEFANAVRTANMNLGLDPRLANIDKPAQGAAPANFHQNQGSAGEGFLVPIDYRQEIWSLTFDPSDILGMLSPVPTASNTIRFTKDETTPWGASGVQAYWRAEAGQMTASKAAVAGELVTLNELYAFVLASDEVLSDAPQLQNRLTVQAARAIRWQASDAVFWGDGNGKPLGFQNAASTIVQTKESGQSAGTLVLANLLKMLTRMLFMGGTPMWLANIEILPQLAALTIGNVPAWLPLNKPIEGSPIGGYLLGYPIVFTEHAQALGTQGDINLINLDGYFSATKAGGGIDFAASIHLYFDYGLQAFRWAFRFGGQPILSKAVSPAHGSTTKSHFIALQAR